MRLNLLRVLSVQIDDASLSAHTLLFSGSGGHLLLSLPCFRIFFSPTGNCSLNYEVYSYEKMGHEELLLWTSSSHPAFWTHSFHFPLCCYCWMWLIFGLSSRILSDIEQKGSSCFSTWSPYKYEKFIFVIFHCLSTNDLSFNYFLTCELCSKYFRSTGVFFVIFFVSSSILFSALTEVKWISSLCIFFCLCLLPLQCCLFMGGSNLLFSFDVFALLLF